MTLGLPRRGPGAVWTLALVLAVAAVLVTAALPAPAVTAPLPWWVLVVAFAVAERCAVHVHFRRGAYTLTLGELPLVVGLLLADPAVIAPAWAAGVSVVLLADRVPPVRVAFNAAQLALMAGLAAAVAHALGVDGAVSAPATWAAAGAGVLVAALGSALLTAGAMTLSGERVPLHRLPPMLAAAVGLGTANLSLGLAIAVVLAAGPQAAPLLAGPVAATFLASRAYATERTRNAGLRFLYDAAHTLGGAREATAGVAGMLALALDTFRAERASVILLPDGARTTATSVDVGPGDALALDHELGAAATGAVRGLLERRGLEAAVFAAGDLPAPLAAHLRRAGHERVVLAPLPGDDRLVGLLVLGERVGTADAAYTADDLRLIGTLAAHVGAVLGHDRLERRVEALREREQHLEHQAFHDELTGLANRLLFLDRVNNALARRAGNAAVLYIDLDEFKPVNDTYGHEAGDVLLRTVGDRLRATLRPADTPARLGGDEFAVLLVDICPEDVPVVAERIVRSFAAPVDVGGAHLPIKASIGTAVHDSGTSTGAELLKEADAAMYVRKHGRGRAPSIR